MVNRQLYKKIKAVYDGSEHEGMRSSENRVARLMHLRRLRAKQEHTS